MPNRSDTRFSRSGGYILFQSEFETLTTSDGRKFFQSERGRAGFVLFGPYELYQPGNYCLNLDITVEDFDESQHDVSKHQTLCGYVEVTSSYGTVVIERTNLYISRLLKSGKASALYFDLANVTELEFRVFSTGKSCLRISSEVLVKTVTTKGYSPVIDSLYTGVDDFFAQNFTQIRNIYEHGVDIDIRLSEIVATCAGISFYIQTKDDLQIVHEIFLLREYDVLLNKPALAVDIGMNVGLTSLYLSRYQNVMEVHSFEPFNHPFIRAQANFRLNPELSKKINPMQIGLSGDNQQLSVLSNTESPIGTSIKGRLMGTPEVIEIRDAASILKPLMSRAKSNEWEIILKIDCEGSEFSILDSLVKADMLKDIRVVMIEWHKWWSAYKSQADLIKPLIDQDFIIFDRTVASNQWAGMLFGVRMN